LIKVPKELKVEDDDLFITNSNKSKEYK